MWYNSVAFVLLLASLSSSSFVSFGYNKRVNFRSACWAVWSIKVASLQISSGFLLLPSSLILHASTDASYSVEWSFYFNCPSLNSFTAAATLLWACIWEPKFLHLNLWSFYQSKTAHLGLDRYSLPMPMLRLSSLLVQSVWMCCERDYERDAKSILRVATQKGRAIKCAEGWGFN